MARFDQLAVLFTLLGAFSVLELSNGASIISGVSESNADRQYLNKTIVSHRGKETTIVYSLGDSQSGNQSFWNC